MMVLMSMRNRLGFDPLWIMVGLLGLLLPALAVTQYLWLNRLSEWQERRTLQVLQTGADRLAEEFDAALEPFQQAFQFLFDPWAPDGPERQFAATSFGGSQARRSPSLGRNSRTS